MSRYQLAPYPKSVPELDIGGNVARSIYKAGDPIVVRYSTLAVEGNFTFPTASITDTCEDVSYASTTNLHRSDGGC